ncbi:hypothetical protein [Methylorubrum populi]|nr:hypothetical protein [Methylorubrum populi]
MSDNQAAIEAALRAAVDYAIRKVGISGLKSTSLFLSNERATAKKAA